MLQLLHMESVCICGSLNIQNYHYYLYITMVILITQIVSLNIKIMLIQEYFDSALLLLTGLVATVLFLGDSFADQCMSDLKEVTLYLN
jgi:hypothetical protein